MQNTHTLKMNIIHDLELIPANRLQLLADFVAFLKTTSSQEAREISMYQASTSPQEPGRWEKMSARIQQHPPLHGVGNFVRECSAEFREDFAVTSDDE